jgi:hypothetical protein
MNENYIGRRESKNGANLNANLDTAQRSEQSSHGRIQLRGPIKRACVTVQSVMQHDSDYCSTMNRNWLRRPALHHIATHVFKSQGFPGFTNSLLVVCFYAHSYSDTSRKPPHRTYLHRLQHLSGLGTLCITRLSIRSTTIYSSSHLATIEWSMKIIGMIELGGANSLMFVEDGVTSYTPRHST